MRSTFALLMSLDEYSLCELLLEVDGQLLIREDVVLHHRLLWEDTILEEVRLEGSVWHESYADDCFRSFEVRRFGYIPWEKLSNSQQEKVILESLRSVEVPSGKFMMGA